MRSRTTRGDRATDAVPIEGIVHLAEFRAALRLFQRRSEEIARRWALTPQRHLMLLMIKGARDGSQRLNLTELAERLQLSRNTVTELATRAEEAGLVERIIGDEDQRFVYLHLTAEGERRLRGAVLEGQSYRDELGRSFAELNQAYRALSRAGSAGA